MAKLPPDTTTRVDDGRTVDVPLSALCAVRCALFAVRCDPRDVPRIVALSKATYRKMIQNLWWAAGYNIIAIPLVAGVMQPWGVVLSLAVGAVLMSFSTIIVAVNAQLLRRAQL